MKNSKNDTLPISTINDYGKSEATIKVISTDHDCTERLTSLAHRLNQLDVCLEQRFQQLELQIQTTASREYVDQQLRAVAPLMLGLEQLNQRMNTMGETMRTLAQEVTTLQNQIEATNLNTVHLSRHLDQMNDALKNVCSLTILLMGGPAHHQLDHHDARGEIYRLTRLLNKNTYVNEYTIKFFKNLNLFLFAS